MKEIYFDMQSEGGNVAGSYPKVRNKIIGSMFNIVSHGFPSLLTFVLVLPDEEKSVD